MNESTGAGPISDMISYVNLPTHDITIQHRLRHLTGYGTTNTTINLNRKTQNPYNFFLTGECL